MRRNPVAARPTVLVVFGTRPEAIKLAPVITHLGRHAPRIRTCVCVTAQHREMLDRVLSLFGIDVDHDLDLMVDNQDLFDITSRTLSGLRRVIERERPDLIIVQGDTTTTLAAALAGYYGRVPVAHVEAGLRTHDLNRPYPEEANRRLTDHLAAFLFAPTERAKRNLLAEGLDASSIHVTGNTGIDALLMMVGSSRACCEPSLTRLDASNRRMLLVTAHRRESFGEPLENICRALRLLVEMRGDVEVVYPVHLNPNVQEPVRRMLGGTQRIHLIEPLDYDAFVQLMDRAYLILTDSGGIQEEAPSLGKPVLVLRDTTERQEAVEAGTATLAGTDPRRIVGEVQRLLDDEAAYAAHAHRRNPFGDGRAAERIVDVIVSALHPAGMGVPVGRAQAQTAATSRS